MIEKQEILSKVEETFGFVDKDQTEQWLTRVCSTFLRTPFLHIYLYFQRKVSFSMSKIIASSASILLPCICLWHLPDLL